MAAAARLPVNILQELFARAAAAPAAATAAAPAAATAAVPAAVPPAAPGGDSRQNVSPPKGQKPNAGAIWSSSPANKYVGAGSVPAPGSPSYNQVVTQLSNPNAGTVQLPIGNVKAGEYGDRNFDAYANWAQHLPTYRSVNWGAEVPATYVDYAASSDPNARALRGTHAIYDPKNDRVELNPRTVYPQIAGRMHPAVQREYDMLQEELVPGGAGYEAMRSDLTNLQNGTISGQQQLFDTLTRWLPQYEQQGRMLPEDPTQLRETIELDAFDSPRQARGTLGHELTHPYTMDLSKSYQDTLRSLTDQAFSAGGASKGAQRYLSVPTETVANSTQLFAIGGHPMRTAVRAAEAETGKKWADLPAAVQEEYFQRGVESFRANTGQMIESGEIPNTMLQTLYKVMAAPEGRKLLEHMGRTWSSADQKRGRAPAEGRA